MPLFKKRKTEQKAKVYMPVRKEPVIIRRKKNTFTLFHKKEKSYTSNRRNLTILPFFRIVLLLILIAGVFYFSAVFVINLRNRNPLDNYQKEYVVGLDNIPSYPLSEFIFSESLDQVSVSNFISNGNSAYRLPLNKKIEDVYEYYNLELPTLGWEHALSVPVGSEEMKSGEYWIKDNKGLRIYSKFNDVWYELINIEEAQNGLSDRVKKEVERDLLLANQELQDLLPDFPWVLKIPKEYVISYKSANYKDTRTVEFKRLGSEEKISLIPITASNGSPLDSYLDNYIKNLNKDSEYNWGISKTTIIYATYGMGLRGEINGGDQNHEIAVLISPNDSLVYILDSNVVDNPFFEFILSNLQPQETFKY
ncbi:MAG: hypothetical protein AB9915_02660 [Candidatus Dojkabacteria bacterium]